jgi:hypothetical protein
MRLLHSSRIVAASLVAAGALGLSGIQAVDPVPIKAPVPVAPKAPGPADEKGVRALLKERSKLEADPVSLQDLLAILAKEHGLTVRIDLAGFKRFGTFDGGGMARADRAAVVFVALRAAAINTVEEIYDVKIRVTAGQTLADLLTDVCAQLPGKCAYRIRHNQVLIGPAFQPPVIPGASSGAGEAQMSIPANVLAEQLLGEPVSIAIEDRPLTQAIAELRRITGANIVLDARTKEKSKQVVSGTFDDVRLLTALELLADMCDLKVVSNNNVFYVTSVENAAKMQKQIHRDLFGEPQPAPMLNTLGGLGGGGGIPPAKDEPKK